MTFPKEFCNSHQSYKVLKRINVTDSLMYNVVSDVSKYQDFVPFVEKSFITAKDKENGLPLKGGLRVGWNDFNEEFICELKCVPRKQVIAESLSLLLFESLYTEWNFSEIKNPFAKEPSCEVELILKYKFKNPLYNTVSSLFSDQVSKIMIEAFEKRAFEEKVKAKK